MTQNGIALYRTAKGHGVATNLLAVDVVFATTRHILVMPLVYRCFLLMGLYL